MEMMPENIKIIVNTFVKEVKEFLGEHLKRVILYGSYARGDFNSESDIDIMILTDLVGEDFEKAYTQITDISYDVESDNDFVIHLSPLLKNINDYNERIEFIPFYMNVQKEGVEL